MSFAGRFIWRELMSTDTEAAGNFYKAMFGWKANVVEMPNGPYTMLKSGENDAGGMMAVPMPGMPSFWLDYISVDDVAASIAKVEELGGKAHTGVIVAPGVGQFASVEDPTGAAFGLFTGEDEGATDTDSPPANHTFCWSQLMTKDLDAVVPFYSAIFGWEPEPVGPGMVFLKRGDKTVATAMKSPAESPAPNHWLKYVAVEDADAAFAKATTLGAQTIHPPMTMEGMGRFAIVADPAGAAFALWKDLGGAQLMQYLLLIYQSEAGMAEIAQDPEKMGPFMGGFKSFTEGIVKSGEFLAGEALDDTPTATSVRVRQGKVVATDGPFAETREALGGFYMVEARDLDRAIEIAAGIPSAQYGTIEVRPIKVWDVPAE